MRTVIVTLQTAVSQLPEGTIPGGIKISFTGGVVPPQTVASPYSATFNNVPAGDYIVIAQAVDSAGQPLGDAKQSTQFHVSASTVGVDVPMQVTVAVQ
jgi:hypothetical protein